MDPMEFIERDDHWEIVLHGRTVTRCCFDNYLVIDFLDEDNKLTYLRIGGPFELSDEDGTFLLSREEPNIEVGRVLTLLRRQVLGAVAQKSGQLQMSFEGGYQLVVNPKYEYEAWELADEFRNLMICIPGGDLAVWLSKP